MLLVIFHIHLKDLRRPKLNVSNENDLILFPCFTVFKSLHEPDCGLSFPREEYETVPDATSQSVLQALGAYAQVIRGL